MKPPLQLPTIQNWSCHNCSGCCRQHLIEITDEERRRIEQQGWTAADGIPAGQPLVVRMNWLGKPRYRLAHQADGACVFLDERGLCRIHARFGEATKPLACRIYPYAFHPSGKKVAVSLRFSCPSVVANRGRAVSENAGEIKELGRLVVGERWRTVPPPEISPGERVDWPDFLGFVDALDATFAPHHVPVLTKLLRALFWMNLVAQSRFDKVHGPRLQEFLDLIRQAAETELTVPPAQAVPPTRAGRGPFRMLAAQYARKDTLLSTEAGWRGRWRLLRAAVRFARGTGQVPVLQDGFRPVRFEQLEAPFGFPAEAEEIFTRYFRVKIQGLHFCGPAYYGVPFVEGFRSLALVFPAVLWLGRWLAAGEDRGFLSVDDVARALAVADHHHGYSPALGHWGARRRVNLLARSGDLERLCVWYAR